MRPRSTQLMDRIPNRMSELWKHQDVEENNVYVMDAMEGHIYELNETAGLLWRLIDGQLTVGAVIAACLESYEIEDLDEARESLVDYLQELQKLNLIDFRRA